MASPIRASTLFCITFSRIGNIDTAREGDPEMTRLGVHRSAVDHQSYLPSPSIDFIIDRLLVISLPEILGIALTALTCDKWKLRPW